MARKFHCCDTRAGLKSSEAYIITGDANYLLGVRALVETLFFHFDFGVGCMKRPGVLDSFQYRFANTQDSSNIAAGG